MTLPTDIIFPLQSDLIKAGDPQSLELYLRNLIDSLSEMYQQIVYNVNGSINQFTPTVGGTTIPGDGTYTRQAGWYLRQGIIVDFWFDIIWTAHTGTGDAFIQLPYQVALSDVNPFAGTLATAQISFTGGRTATFCLAVPNTFQCSPRQYGSGVGIAVIALPASGRFVGHIRYIGKEFEN